MQSKIQSIKWQWLSGHLRHQFGLAVAFRSVHCGSTRYDSNTSHVGLDELFSLHPFLLTLTFTVTGLRIKYKFVFMSIVGMLLMCIGIFYTLLASRPS